MSEIIENKSLSSHNIQLNDGNFIPSIAFGTSKRRTTIKSYINDAVNPRTPEEILKDKQEDIEDEKELSNALYYAMQNGYRHIDTAQVYRTEAAIGNFLNEYLANNNKNISRNDLWITTKISKLKRDPNDVELSIKKSLNDLQTDYIDLFLIHSPHTMSPNGSRGEDVINIYKILHKYKQNGYIYSVGVSNFGLNHLKKLEELCIDLPLPSVNQIEVHCFLYEKELIEYCLNKGILIEAYCPIGRAKEDICNHGLLNELSKKYNKTWAQIMIKYLHQKGFIVITKSSKMDRIVENVNIFDFVIDNYDIKQLDRLNTVNRRVSWNCLHEPWDV